MFLDLILVVGLLTGCQTVYFWDLSQLYPRRFEKLPLGVPVLAGALLAGGLCGSHAICFGGIWLWWLRPCSACL